MNDRERPTIKQVIVVEGRDDEAAVLRAVQATTIATHGYGIRGETLELIGKAYREQGIILFTDPDHAGREIRRRLTRLFPGAGQAYLTVEEAEKNGDIGIENADAASIRSALDAAGAARKEAFAQYTADDLWRLGLTGGPRARERRTALGKALGIGEGNAAAFLKKLNGFGITREALQKAWEDSIPPEGAGK